MIYFLSVRIKYGTKRFIIFIHSTQSIELDLLNKNLLYACYKHKKYDKIPQ